MYRSLSTSQLAASSYIRCDDPSDDVIFNPKRSNIEPKGINLVDDDHADGFIRRKGRASSYDDLAMTSGKS